MKLALVAVGLAVLASGAAAAVFAETNELTVVVSGLN
jgi:hypothetical protein